MVYAARRDGNARPGKRGCMRLALMCHSSTVQRGFRRLYYSSAAQFVTKCKFCSKLFPNNLPKPELRSDFECSATRIRSSLF